MPYSGLVIEKCHKHDASHARYYSNWKATNADQMATGGSAPKAQAAHGDRGSASGRRWEGQRLIAPHRPGTLWFGEYPEHAIASHDKSIGGKSAVKQFQMSKLGHNNGDSAQLEARLLAAELRSGSGSNVSGGSPRKTASSRGSQSARNVAWTGGSFSSWDSVGSSEPAGNIKADGKPRGHPHHHHHGHHGPPRGHWSQHVHHRIAEGY